MWKPLFPPKGKDHGIQKQQPDPTSAALLATKSIEAGAVVVMAGTLYRLKDFIAGVGGKVWQKRYVMLQQDALYIYHQEQQFSHKKKKVPLVDSKIGTAEQLTSRPHSFGVVVPRKGRVFVFAADSAELQQRWIQTMLRVQHALENSRSAIFDLGELERELVVAPSAPPLPLHLEIPAATGAAAEKVTSPSGVKVHFAESELEREPRQPKTARLNPQDMAPTVPVADETVHKKLIQMVKHGRYMQLSNELQSLNYPVNSVDPHDGNTLLHIAAQEGQTRCLKLLLRNRANYNIPNARADQPLHLAVKFGFEETACYLVSKGADVESVDGRGRAVGQEAGAKMFFQQIEALGQMGFVDRARCIRALLKTEGDIAKAALRLGRGK